MAKPVIWVEGIIGSGKTTLATAMAKQLNLRLLLEPLDTGYLEKFYKDPKRWAFPFQIELLMRRFALQKLAVSECNSLVNDYEGVVLDRGLPGDRVFCKLHCEAGNMSELEWKTYERGYEVMTEALRPPSLLIFLDVDPQIALERVNKRARNEEVNLTLNYLQKLRAGYLDLLVEVESGKHEWARGIEVQRIPWNTDFQDPRYLFKNIQAKYRLWRTAGILPPHADMTPS